MKLTNLQEVQRVSNAVLHNFAEENGDILIIGLINACIRITKHRAHVQNSALTTVQAIDLFLDVIKDIRNSEVMTNETEEF